MCSFPNLQSIRRSARQLHHRKQRRLLARIRTRKGAGNWSGYVRARPVAETRYRQKKSTEVDGWSRSCDTIEYVRESLREHKTLSATLRIPISVRIVWTFTVEGFDDLLGCERAVDQAIERKVLECFVVNVTGTCQSPIRCRGHVWGV